VRKHCDNDLSAHRFAPSRGERHLSNVVLVTVVAALVFLNFFEKSISSSKSMTNCCFFSPAARLVDPSELTVVAN